MKYSILFVTLLVIFCSCNQSDDYLDDYLCTCKYNNAETNVETTSIDTIKNIDEAKAEEECSNYGTTDDPNESISCIVKKITYF